MSGPIDFARAVSVALLLASAACERAEPETPPPAPAAAPAPDRPGTDASLARPEGPVTFNRDIAPIVFGICADCHRPGESAPFPLLSYEDTVRRAQLIVAVTKIRYMPPWQPTPGYAEFFGDRSLSDAQIALFAQWLADGTPEGDPADLPELPERTPGWQFGEPDLVVEMPVAYTVPADGVDVFRNFVIPLPTKSDRYVRSIEIRPGNNRVVHHATLKIDRSGSARELDRLDPGPGYDGMNDLGNEMPGGRFIGWTPGKLPLPPSRRSNWTLPAGADLVLDLHMLPTGKPEPVRPRVGFVFTDEPPERPAYPLLLEFRQFTIPAGDPDFTLDTTFETPVDLEISSVYPHAHYLGRRMSIHAELPDGTKRWLLRIDRWDFNWQDEYRYAEPVAIPAGSTIHMQYTWDNSAENVRNPNRPPKPVSYGGQSTDEMGTAILQLDLRNEADLARLEEASTRHRITRWPNDWNAHRRLGHLLSARGDHAGAATHFEQLVRRKPGLMSGHYNLAREYQLSNRAGPAMKHYRETLAIDPEHLDALNNLGVLLASEGKLEPAIRNFERVLSIDPSFVRARKNLDYALSLRGKRGRPGALQPTAD